MYNRFGVYVDWTFNRVRTLSDAEGEWVKAEDAINHHAVLMARIRTLEVQREGRPPCCRYNGP